jgi:small-conductance mechanosensitive channel
MSPVLVLLANQQPADDPTNEPGALSRWVGDLTGQQWLEDLVAVSIEPLAEAFGIIVLAWITSRLVRRGIAKIVEEMKDPDHQRRIGLIKKRVRLGALQEGDRPRSLRRIQRADALGALLKSVASGVIWTVAAFMVLGAFGVNLGPLIAGAGIVGVALGFGSQALVRDFLSGIFMLVEDQYGVGDIIDAGEAAGVVEGVGLRTTRIRDVNGTLWHLPNGEIQRVGNMSQEWARTLLDVGVSYGTDIDQAAGIILDVATRMAAEDDYVPAFLDEPEIWGVERLGPDSVDIRLVVKTKPGDQWGIGRELRRRIKLAFDAAGIEIPFSQRTVWLRTDATGADRAPAIELSGSGAGAGAEGAETGDSGGEDERDAGAVTRPPAKQHAPRSAPDEPGPDRRS